MRFKNISNEGLYVPALRLAVEKHEFTPDFDEGTAAGFVFQTDVWEAEDSAAAHALRASLSPPTADAAETGEPPAQSAPDAPETGDEPSAGEAAQPPSDETPASPRPRTRQKQEG